MALAGLCGGDPRVVGAVYTFPMWLKVAEIWHQEPPVHRMLAWIAEGRYGYKPPKKQKTGDVGDLIGIFGGLPPG